VQAEASSHEALVEVRIRTEDEPPSPPPLPDERIIRWRGAVPAQIWMNLYTKVLTKFVAVSRLKLEVSVEVLIERDQAQTKADETRAGLKELGLGENVSID
jgi:hypothetical protein